MKIKYLAMAAAALMSASQANATAFILNYTGTSAAPGGFTGNLSGDVTGGVITTIAGTANGSSVTGLSSYAGATQQLNLTSPYTNFGGFSFSTASAGNFNIYFEDGAYHQLSSITDPSGTQVGDPLTSFNVSAVPEPATWLMMLGGFFMVGFGLRSRKRSVLAPVYG